MSATSVKTELTFGGGRLGQGGHEGAAPRDPSLLDMISLSNWRKLTLETCAFLAVILAIQISFPGLSAGAGLPHPYWIPVLLAAAQYGVSGGAIAAVAASLLYVARIAPPSAAQDIYSFTSLTLAQPAAWMATALVLGGLRNLHLRQYAALSDQLASSRRRADELSAGLGISLAEINALERRIAVDMGSVAALTRSLSQLDLKDRWTAAASFGELFRVASSVPTFVIYLFDGSKFVPVAALEDGAVATTNGMQALAPAAVRAMIRENATPMPRSDGNGSCRVVVPVPAMLASGVEQAAIVCDLDPSQDMEEFRGRSQELSRAFASALSACADHRSVASGR